MGKGVAVLRNMGLLNEHAPDLAGLQSSGKKLVAYCTSRTCTTYKDDRGYWHTLPGSRVPRDPKQGDDNCQYCHFALIYRWE